MEFTDKALLNLERTCGDLRRGVPAVVVNTDGSGLLVMPAEHMNKETLRLFDSLVADSFIMLTNNRALTLKVAGKGWSVVRLARAKWLTAEDMIALADPTLDLSTPMKGPFKRMEHAETSLDQAAIKLVKWAHLLPAVLAADVASAAEFADKHGLMAVDTETILNADYTQASALKQVASAQVPLAGAEATRLVSFRPITGGVEHIAIIIGDPSSGAPVLTRIHSECFTGDLLGSLKCDCGEQLKGAVAAIEEAGGGIVLYMAQEGRGIGLVSKLKAYALQDQGYDTVDANTRLGFEVDERIFAPAADMLKSLGFTKVRLMTNNPNKVEGLEGYGIKVTERVAHAFPTNPHNESYLATKKNRTGHIL